MQLPDTSILVCSQAHRTIVQMPSSSSNDAAVREIKSRGNVPLLIGDSILAEVAVHELSDGLCAADELSDLELSRIARDLAHSLSDAVATDCTQLDMAEVASDAAALFVLCLKRQKIADVDNIPACSVSFDSVENQAVLTLAS